MASYGVFLAACGFEYHGPKGHLGFAPRLTPEDFKAAFTAAEGWGTFAQKRSQGRLEAVIELKWGTLRLQTLTLRPADVAASARVTVRAGDRLVPATLTTDEGRAEIRFSEAVVLRRGEKLEVVLG